MDYLKSYLPAGGQAEKVAAPPKRQTARDFRAGWRGLNKGGPPDGGWLSDGGNISTEALPALVPSKVFGLNSPMSGHPPIDLPGAPRFSPVSLLCVGEDVIEIFRMDQELWMEYYNAGTGQSKTALLLEEATVLDEGPRNLVRFVLPDGSEKLLLFPDRVSFDYRPENLALTPLPAGFPEMAHAAVWGGRLYGVDGNTLWASAAGDCFDFTSADEDGPWSATLQPAPTVSGGFVAVAEVGGRLALFYENGGWLMSDANPDRAVPLGFGALSPRALATAGGKLLAVGRADVTLFDGRRATSVGRPLGISDFSGAVCGGAGDTFYLYHGGTVYTYPVSTGQWGCLVPPSPVVMFAACGDDLLALCENGQIYRLTSADVNFWFETDLLTLGRPARRRVRRASLMAELGTGGRLSLSLVGTDGHTLEVDSREGPGAVLLSGRVRSGRDVWHRVRVSGTGPAKIYGLALDAEF